MYYINGSGLKKKKGGGGQKFRGHHFVCHKIYFNGCITSMVIDLRKNTFGVPIILCVTQSNGCITSMVVDSKKTRFRDRHYFMCRQKE